MLKGNLKGFEAEWQVTPVDATRTLVAFELCADPNFNIPFARGLVSDYNEKEARSSIAALRRQVSRTHRALTFVWLTCAASPALPPSTSRSHPRPAAADS